MPQHLKSGPTFRIFREVEIAAVVTGLALLSVACSSTADYYPPEYYSDQPDRYYQVDPGPAPANYGYQTYQAPVIVNERPVAPSGYYETYADEPYAAPVITEHQPLIQGEILTQQELDALERRQRELNDRHFGEFRAPANPPPPAQESAYTEQQADETARRLAEAQETFARKSTPTMPLGNVSKPDVYRPVYVEPEPAAPVYHAPPPVVGGYSLVQQVQRALHDRGYPVGKIDGVMGSRTRNALGSFQAANGLPMTRSPDPATLQALGVYYAQSAPPAGYLPPVADYRRYK